MDFSSIAEESLLGSFLYAPEIYEQNKSGISKELFSSSRTQKVLEIIEDWTRHYPDANLNDNDFLIFTQSQYSEWFDRNKELIGQCLRRAVDKDVSIEKWPNYLKTLEKLYYSRISADFFNNIKDKILSDPLNIDTHLRASLDEASKLSSSLEYNKSEFDLAETINNYQEDYWLRLQDDFSPSKFGLFSIDEMFGGYYPFTYNIISARSSVGKSAFVNTINRNMVEQQGKKIAIFNLETDNNAYLRRWFSKDLKINSKILKNPKLMTSAQREALLANCETFYQKFNKKIHLIEGVYYIDQIVQKIINIYNHFGLDGVFIDLIGYVTSKERHEKRQMQIASISNALFQLTRKYPIFITVVQQQNKDGDNKKGEQSSGRESEDPFIQADTAISLSKTLDATGKTDNDKRIVTITKNRDGELGSAEIKFTKEFTLFQDEILGGTLS